MGKRDYRHREEKKPKKEAKKVTTASVLQVPTTVDVARHKGKKEEFPEE